jgi:hypothetical protein
MIIQKEPEQIMETFFYRKNPFAVKTSKGFYVPVYRDVTILDIVKHIEGKHVIGAYQSRSDETCVWACIDFDSVEYNDVAKKIAEHYKPGNVSSIVRDTLFEISESKGSHVWFFFNKVVATPDAYVFLETILTMFGLKKGRDAKIDIFPRSAHLSGKRVGWLVRIPR